MEAGQPWRWTVEQYGKLTSHGDWLFFGELNNQRVELIGGQIIAVRTMTEAHACALSLTLREFTLRLPRSLRVLARSPLHLSPWDMPDPDITVGDGSTERQQEIPTTARLVLEVSDFTLSFDRTTKASLYASARIAEYWILDVNACTLEVLRDPMEDAASPSGWRYGRTQVLREDALISPLCAPEVELSVHEMLP